MKNKLKLGFFDSGVGGISVMSYAREIIKNADYIYYADTDHVPYGEKTREEIVEYSDSAIKYLIDCGVDCVVIACNTATSMAVDILRKKYSVPIIGMEPAVKPASLSHRGEKILVCATPLTICGEKLHNLIGKSYDENNLPTLVPAPGLVKFAEDSVFDTDTVTDYLRSIINPAEGYTAVVLGCTHFSYFRDSFRKLLGDIDLIDGTNGTVNRLIYILTEMGAEVSSEGECTPVTYVNSGRLVNNSELLEYYKKLEQRANELI